MNKIHSIHDYEKSLKILDCLEKDSSATQRDLSRNVNLSLGKINFILSELIKCGYVKASRFKNANQKRAYLYILTPFGIKQKAIMAQNFLERKIREYHRLKEEIEELKKTANG